MHGKIYRSVPALLALALAPAAHALTINLNYTTNVTSRGDSTQIQTAAAYAALQYTSKFSDPITINITVDASASVGLGQSSTPLLGILSYASVKTQLNADKTTANDNAAVASLPASNPGSADNWLIARSEAKALAIIGSDLVNDGTFTFGSTNTYTYDPNNRQVAGAFDFIGVAEHEFSEIMGRINLLGQPLTGSPDYDPFDLFRFASSGVRELAGAGSGRYFSVDNGVTSLHVYNSTSGGDLGDWASGQGADAYNAFTGTNVKNDISAVDYTLMDVIGYDLIVPEPSALSLLALGAFGIARRHRRQPPLR